MCVFFFFPFLFLFVCCKTEHTIFFLVCVYHWCVCVISSIVRNSCIQSTKVGWLKVWNCIEYIICNIFNANTKKRCRCRCRCDGVSVCVVYVFVFRLLFSHFFVIVIWLKLHRKPGKRLKSYTQNTYCTWISVVCMCLCIPVPTALKSVRFVPLNGFSAMWIEIIINPF